MDMNFMMNKVVEEGTAKRAIRRNRIVTSRAKILPYTGAEYLAIVRAACRHLQRPSCWSRKASR